MVRWRAVLAALAGVAVLAVVPATSATAASPAKRCTAKGAKTVAQNRYARLFTTPGRIDETGALYPEGDETGRLYGCMLSVGKRMLLAVAADDRYVRYQWFDHVRLNRRFVAWQFNSYDVSCKGGCEPGYNPTQHSVLARDLRAPRSWEFRGAVKGDSLVLGRRGTPAWLQDATGGAVEVHAGTNVLDSGAVDSLALDVATLSWANAGVPKSEPLDP